jgi:hypothetical protein
MTDLYETGGDEDDFSFDRSSSLSSMSSMSSMSSVTRNVLNINAPDFEYAWDVLHNKNNIIEMKKLQRFLKASGVHEAHHLEDMSQEDWAKIRPWVREKAWVRLMRNLCYDPV